MTLHEYLIKTKQRVADVAKALNVPHCTVRRWVTGEAIPNREYMQKIYEYTGGAVDANSFYNINSANRKELNNAENTHGN